MLLFNEHTEDEIKSKNIRQTEILVDLREAVLQVGLTIGMFFNLVITIAPFRLSGTSCNWIQN